MGICGQGFIFKEKYSTCMLQGVFTIVGKILNFLKKIDIKLCYLHVHVSFVTFISTNIVNKEESLLYTG